MSLFLQSKTVILQDAVGQVNVARRCLERQCTDEAYNLFYQNCLNDSNTLTNPPCLPRARRPPRRIDSDSEPHIFETPLEYYRKIYFEVIDVVVNELVRRFDQASLKIPLAIERLLIQAANWDIPGSIKIDKDLLKFYERDLDAIKLSRQLNMLPDLVKELKLTPVFMHLKSVSSISTIAELLSSSPLTLGVFSEVVKLVKIFMIILITTATAERSFSALRRLKTYLRSTMTQSRLNNILLLHCHKEMTDAIDLTAIAKDFIAAKEKRKTFFGVFP